MKLTVAFLSHILSPLTRIAYDPSGQLIEPTEEMITRSIDTITADSRTVFPGSLFWSLDQEEQAVSDSLTRALADGARTVILEQRHKHLIQPAMEQAKTPVIFVLVKSAEQAALRAAREWRSHFLIPIIGITGSVGKTTTKEMMRSIFEVGSVRAFVSLEPKSSLIHLALEILQLTSEHTVGVFEVGVERIGDMDLLVDLLQPTIGMITNVNHAHLRGLNSLADIAEEKKKIFAQLGPSQIGIVCGDQPLLADAFYSHPIVRFGCKGKNTVVARRVKTEVDEAGVLRTTCNITVYGETISVVLPNNHPGLLYAALAACAAAYFLHIPVEVMRLGLLAFQPISSRFEIKNLSHDRGVLVDDCYASSPESMRAALGAFHQMPQYENKIAVLGDMLDLGEKEIFWHRQIGRELHKIKSMSQLVLIGERARSIAQTAPIMLPVSYADTPEHAQEIVDERLRDDRGIVLVKGSMGMRLESLVQALV